MYKSLTEIKTIILGGEPEAGEIIVKQLKTVAVLTEETWEAPCTHTWRLNPTSHQLQGIQYSLLASSHLHPYGIYSLSLSHTHPYTYGKSIFINNFNSLYETTLTRSRTSAKCRLSLCSLFRILSMSHCRSSIMDSKTDTRDSAVSTLPCSLQNYIPDRDSKTARKDQVKKVPNSTKLALAIYNHRKKKYPTQKCKNKVIDSILRLL